MTAPHIVDPARVLGNLLTDASPDMMRSLLQTMINALLSADADAVCGAEWGQPSADRQAEAPQVSCRSYAGCGSRLRVA